MLTQTGKVFTSFVVSKLGNSVIIKYKEQVVKKELMEILVCPVCKGQLQLSVTEEHGGEIVSGSLYCGKCSYSYPITDTIPNLLPPSHKG